MTSTHLVSIHLSLRFLQIELYTGVHITGTHAQQKSGMCNATCVTTRLCVLDRYSHLTLHMTCWLSTTVRDVQKATDIKQLLWRFATNKETPTGARAEEKTFFGKMAPRCAVA